MNEIYIGIGGNLGNRIQNLEIAIKLINEKIAIPEKVSSVYLSEPWGFTHAKYFTNIVAMVRTSLSADEVLEKAFEIEQILKRKRSGNGYEGRTMDIDILFCNSEIINTKDLVVPHPRICDRKFVLLPMAEISPEFKHPGNGKTMKELAQICKDNSKIRKLWTMKNI